MVGVCRDADGAASNVVVQALSSAGARAQLSIGDGVDPVWSADGRTLYYLKGDVSETAVYAVNIAGKGAGVTAGPPRELFRRPDSQGCEADPLPRHLGGRSIFAPGARTPRSAVGRPHGPGPELDGWAPEGSMSCAASFVERFS